MALYFNDETGQYDRIGDCTNNRPSIALDYQNSNQMNLKDQYNENPVDK